MKIPSSHLTPQAVDPEQTALTKNANARENAGYAEDT